MINIDTLIDKYYNQPTNVYYVVDQEFLNGFNTNQAPFMLFTYYKFYMRYCEEMGLKVRPIDTFLKNARRKKVKIVQQCCPYCGRINIMFTIESVRQCDAMKYCVSCGKKSTSQIIFEEVAAFIRVNMVHRTGLEMLKREYTASEEFIGYDVWLTEIVQLATILETTLREFYFDLVCMRHRCYEEEFIIKSIKKQSKNDFMNIDKANDHYKKALDINLKNLISSDVVLNLKDLLEIRNIAVHNNGRIDEKFKISSTYDRLKSHIKGDFIFLHQELLEGYLLSILEVANVISALYEEQFKKEKFLMISNHYFNIDNMEDVMVSTEVSFICGINESDKSMSLTFVN